MNNKKWIIAACLISLMAVAATVVKISEFPNTATLSNNDLFVVASGSTNKNIKYGDLVSQLNTNLSTSGGSQVWTNDGEFTWITDLGAPNLTPYGFDPGPAVLIRNDGSLFLGTNVYSDSDVSDLNLWHPLHALSLTESNQPSAALTQVTIANNPDWDFYTQFYVDMGADKDTPSGTLALVGKGTNAIKQFAFVRVDPANSQDGTCFELRSGFNVTFKADVQGVVQATRLKPSSTNAMTLACPNGGSFILTVGNDGTLNVITNSTGL